MSSQELLTRLNAAREAARSKAEQVCLTAQNAGRDTLDGIEQRAYDSHKADMIALDQRIAEETEDLERSKLPASLAHLQRGGGAGGRHVNSAGRLAPLSFDIEEMRAAHTRLARGETVVLETRDFTSAVGLLPSQLYPMPTFPLVENRLLDRLPGFALEAPSLEYIQVNTMTGAAAVVGEGQLKPELDLPATKLTIPALKVAVHAGISWESMNDWEAFTQAVQTQLLREIVRLENQQLVYGTGGGTELNGILSASGILTFTATGHGTNNENFTDIAGAISHMRTGPALAEPDLLLLHPATFANLRTQQDQMGRFYVAADPSQTQVEQIWGVPVLQSIAFTPGDAILLDTKLFGRVAVREAITLRIGYANDDLVRNILRHVCEERLNVAVERPAAVCYVTGLPTAAPTEATTTKSTAKK